MLINPLLKMADQRKDELMFELTKEDFESRTGASFDVGDSIYVEASTLGFDPGFWPERIIVGSDILVRRSFAEVDNEGDILGFTYTSPGKMLKVFND